MRNARELTGTRKSSLPGWTRPQPPSLKATPGMRM
jgi:hypothetical protein